MRHRHFIKEPTRDGRAPLEELSFDSQQDKCTLGEWVTEMAFVNSVAIMETVSCLSCRPLCVNCFLRLVLKLCLSDFLIKSATPPHAGWAFHSWMFCDTKHLYHGPMPPHSPPSNSLPATDYLGFKYDSMNCTHFIYEIMTSENTKK